MTRLLWLLLSAVLAALALCIDKAKSTVEERAFPKPEEGKAS